MAAAKPFLEKQRQFKGEEVLDLLLDQRATAQYITQKIYQFFVNEKMDAEKVEWLADRFYKSDYNIGKADGRYFYIRVVLR